MKNTTKPNSVPNHRSPRLKMPGAKEIRTQINSIGSTRKITKVMEIIAAGKARHRMTLTELARGIK